jgi:hypothetical protein
MIEVEGKMNDQPSAILIDLGASHSYLDPKLWKDSICQEEILENVGWFH